MVGFSVFKGVEKPRIGEEILCCDEEHTVLGGLFVGDNLEDDPTLAVL